MAGEAQIDKLVVQVDVQDSGNGAAKLQALANAMKSVNKEGGSKKFEGYTKGLAALSAAAKQLQSLRVENVIGKITKLNEAFGSANTQSAQNLKTFANRTKEAADKLVEFGNLDLKRVLSNATTIKLSVEAMQKATSVKNINFDNFGQIVKSISENVESIKNLKNIPSTTAAGVNITNLLNSLGGGASSIEGAKTVAEAIPGIVHPLVNNIETLKRIAGITGLTEAGQGIGEFVRVLQKIGENGTKGILPGANAIAGALDKFTSLNVSAFAGAGAGLEQGIKAIKSFAKFIAEYKKPENTTEIDSLAATLKGITKAMAGMPSTFNGEGIEAALTAISQYGDVTKNAAAMAKSLEELSRSLAMLGEESNAENIQKAFGVISQIADSAQVLSKAGNGVGNLARGLARLPDALSNFRKPEMYDTAVAGLKKFIETLNDAIGGFDTKSAGSINSFVKTIGSLGKLSEGLGSGDFTDVGGKITSFIENVNTATSTIGTGDGTNKLRSMVTTITNLQKLSGNHDLTGLVNLGEQLKMGLATINSALGALDNKALSPVKSFLKTINELGMAASNQQWISANLPALADSLKKFFGDIGGSTWQISGQIGESFRAVAQMFREIQAIGGGKAAATFANAGNAFKGFLKSIGELSEDDINGVKVASSSLWNAIHEIVKANNNLAKTNETYPAIGKKYDELAAKIVSFVQTVTSSITPEMEQRLVSVSTAIKDLVSAYRSLGPAQEAVSKSSNKASGIWNKGMVKSVGKTIWSGLVNGIKTAVKWYAKLGSAALSAGKAIGSLAAKPFASFVDRIKGAKSAWDNLVRSVKRVAFYRIIRSAIKMITDGFKEGINNLYGWAQLVGNNFAPTMDSLATSFLYLKNSIGAAVSPLSDALAPAVEFVIAKIVDCINAMNQLFAALTGATTWRKAVRKQKTFGNALDSTGGSAGKAADEIERMLLGIDELNKLPDSKDKSGGGGGGGASGTDYSGMFTVEDVESPFKAWANTDDWTDLGTTLSNYLADGLSKANAWMESKGIALATSWGTRLGTALNGVFQNQEFSKELGTAIGNGINLATTFITTFNDTTKWDALGASIANALRNGVGTIDWVTLGKTISANVSIITGVLHGIADSWTTTDAENLGIGIAEAIKAAWNKVSWSTAIPDAVSLATRIAQTINAIFAPENGGLNVAGMISNIVTSIGNANWSGLVSAVYSAVNNALSSLNEKTWDIDPSTGITTKMSGWERIGQQIGSSLSTVLSAIQWNKWIPSMVSLASGILSAVVTAIKTIKWGPYDKDGTVLNRIWNGIQKADWKGLWKQVSALIKETWPVSAIALAISLTPSIGSVTKTITKALLVKKIFGISQKTETATGLAASSKGVLSTTIPILIGLAGTIQGITNLLDENATLGESALAAIETAVGGALIGGSLAGLVGLGTVTGAVVGGILTLTIALAIKFDVINNVKDELAGIFGKKTEVDTIDPAILDFEFFKAQNPGLSNEEARKLWNQIQQQNGNFELLIPSTVDIRSFKDSIDPNNKLLENFNGQITKDTDAIDPKTKILKKYKANIADFANKVDEKKRLLEKFVANLTGANDNISDDDKPEIESLADITNWTGPNSGARGGNNVNVKFQAQHRPRVESVASLTEAKDDIEGAKETTGWKAVHSFFGRNWTKEALDSRTTTGWTASHSFFGRKWTTDTLKSRVTTGWTASHSFFGRNWTKKALDSRTTTGWTASHSFFGRNWTKKALDSRTTTGWTASHSDIGRNWNKKISWITKGWTAAHAYVDKGFSTGDFWTSGWIGNFDTVNPCFDSAKFQTWGWLAWFDYWDTTSNFNKNITMTASISNMWSLAQALADAVRTKLKAVWDAWTGKANGGVYTGGSWKDIPQYAGGTSNAHGSLFVAGEAGPEVVGHIGGRTEVLNRSQLASTMYSAVTHGMANAINAVRIAVEPKTLYSQNIANSTSNNATPEPDNIWMENMARKIAGQITTANNTSAGEQPIIVMLDSEVLFRSTVKANRKNTIRTGRNALTEG